jgi:hypothetical protein
MALEVGSVTVDPEDASATGTGLAFAIYDAMNGQFTEIEGLPLVKKLSSREGMANFATALAAGLVPYLTANSEIEVTVHTTDAGLQRTPNPNNPDTDTQGPATDKTLAGTLT